jgi:uncharacterized protein (DUF2236 family)
VSASYFTNDSVVARVHADPALIIGGIRALMEQALHPQAMAGVAKYSDFRDDAWGRLRRTGDYLALFTYGVREEVDRAAERVRMLHHRLGLDTQEELLWVHTSMVDAFIDVALRSGMPLSELEVDEYLREMVLFAELVGVDRATVPSSYEELKNYMIGIQPKLAATEEAKRTAVFLTFPPMSLPIRLATPAPALWASVATLAAASLPRWARDMYGWPTFPGQELVTNRALRAFRSNTLKLPASLRLSQYQRQQRNSATLAASK